MMAQRLINIRYVFSYRTLFATLALLVFPMGVWGEDISVTLESHFGTSSSSCWTLINGNTYTLTDNITLSRYLYIPSGSTVTINLNGHALNRGMAGAQNNCFVIKIDGTLTIQDSGTGGTITGGYNNSDGGGIYNNGTLTLTGGTITGNRVASGKNGAGIYNSTTATLNISGKVIVTNNTISGSTTTPNNVYIPSGKSINITGDLDAATSIGVTLQANYGVFTSGLNTYSGGFNNFSADGTNAEIKMTAVNVEAETIYSYEHIQELIDASPDSPSEATVITLNSTKNYESKSNSSGGTYLHITSKKKITIDLNGRTIYRSVYGYPENGFVIKNEGTLTIQNSGGGEGYITGGKNSGNGGGIYNTSTGLLTVTGGRIFDNSATGNGGGIYNDGGSVTISGGEIFRCNSTQGNGGGIYNASGTLTITSGKLWRNWVKPTCKGGGIYFESGTFNLSGNPEIYNHNSLSNESEGYGSFDKPSNIYLANGQKITIADNLTGGDEKIGITMETPAEFTSGLYGRGTQGKFFVDENKSYDYYHDLTNNNPFVLELSTNETSHEAQLQSYWSKLQTEITNAANGSTITLNRGYMAHSSDTYLHIAAGKTITIALNSHTLDRNLSAKRTNGEVIRNDGILTLSGLGYIYRGYNEGDGGGIYNNGTLILDCPSDNCTWISDNHVSEGFQGAGIFNTAEASITMKGGIYMCCNYIVSNTDINSNVYLPSGKKITIGDGGIKTNSQIPITHADDRIEFTTGLNWPHNSTFPFRADSNTKRVGRTSSGEAIIGPALILTPIVTGNGSIGITAGQKAIEGEEVTFSVSAETGNVPFSLSYTPEESVATPITCWDNGTYSFTMSNNPTTVSAVFKQGGFCGATDHENEVKYYLADDNETLTFITKNDENVAMYASYASADDVPWNKEGQTINYSKVSLSDHVTSISPYAFFGSSISSIDITSGVTVIGAMALANCQSLTSIVSQSGSFYAGDNVLYNNGQTELVCLPSGLTSTSFTLPNTITEVRDGAFAYNNHLTTINVESGGTTPFSANNGVLYKGTELYCYPARKTGDVYDVASTVTDIKPYAFHNNNLLKVLNINNDNVLTGGTKMFENYNSQLRIMVKKDKGTSYKESTNWIPYKDLIFEMNLANAAASLEYTDHVCTDAALWPDVNGSVTITADGQQITLRKGTDYNVEKNSTYYANNTAVGTATVTIKGAGGYAGTNKALTFTITRELIISGADNRYTYFASEDLTLPSHLTAWTYTAINWETGVMTPTQINYIPANVPVILYRSGASINETLYLTAHTGGAHANPIQYYRGTATAKDIDVLKTEINTELHETAEDIYVLRGENFVRATSGTLPAKHCYLYKPSGTAAPSVLTTTFSAISGGSYKIETLNASNGTVNIQYDNSGTPTNVAVNDTEIPAGKTVTLTITPSDGFYLSALQCEEVTTLGVAMAPARRADKTQEIHKININTNYEGHFAGTYTFPMPRNNVIVTATFVACTSISPFDLTLDGDNVTKTYDRSPHTVTLKNGDTPLEKGTEYGITTGSETYTNVSSNPVTLTGWGRYNGTKSATLSITAKTLNVTADAKSKTYADPDPTFTYTTTGLESGDENVIIGALSRNPGENVGTYTINQNTLSAGSNYSISYTSANLTINQRDISNTAVITLTSDYRDYDGSTFTPGINSITDPSSVSSLVLNTDYNAPTYPTPGVYSQTDHIQPDIYTISVSFIGNYTGTATKEYQVRPKITLSGNNVWYTYYNLTYNMKMPDVVMAYTISGNTETQINISPDNSVGHGYIKAATPMLLYYTGASTDIYPELVKTGDSHLSGISSYTYYHGLSVATDVTSLTEYSTQDIWILVNNQFVRTASGSIPASRCYLALDKNSITVPHFAPAINFGGLTGIDEPRDKKENVEMKIYNLNGQRVQNPTKGLYIVNGKKVIIK